MRLEGGFGALVLDLASAKESGGGIEFSAVLERLAPELMSEYHGEERRLYRRVIAGPAAVRVRIDAAGLVAMVGRAARSKGGKSTAGSLSVRVRPGAARFVRLEGWDDQL